jgi:hypothetical protein
MDTQKAIAQFYLTNILSEIVFKDYNHLKYDAFYTFLNKQNESMEDDDLTDFLNYFPKEFGCKHSKDNIPGSATKYVLEMLDDTRICTLIISFYKELHNIKN